MDIKIKALTKKMDGMEILKNINITVESGESHALVGPNGAGKTTLLNCILGLYTHYQGSIEVSGQNVQSEGFEIVRRKMMFVLDTTGLFVSLNAKDNIEFYDRLCNPKSSKKERENRISNVFSAISLENRQNDMITKYSKGMKQRLALGRTMVVGPELIILDEPYQGLDVEGKHLLTNHLINLKKNGCTILLGSHDLDEVEKICDKVSFIKSGSVVLEKTFKKMRTEV